jgi:hypothetical protein
MHTCERVDVWIPSSPASRDQPGCMHTCERVDVWIPSSPASSAAAVVAVHALCALSCSLSFSLASCTGGVS